MLVYGVHDKVRIVFSLLIEKLEEYCQAFLPEVVPEELDAHEVLVESQGLSNLEEPKVIDLVVSHVQMD